MDALAAYGSDSDDSGSETSHIPTPATTKQTTITSHSGMHGGSTSGKIRSLSTLLPPPKSGGGSSGPSSAAPAKTSKYSSMPTLEDDSDSEEESEFRKKARLAASANSAGSGVGALFAMLPAPKNAPVTPAGSSTGKAATAKTGFMPRTVKKPTPAVVKKPVPTVVDEDHSEDDDDDDEGPVSFFPLGSAATAPAVSGSSKAASNSYIPLFFDKKPLTTEEQQVQNATYVDVSASNEQYAYPSNDQYAYPSNDQYAYPTNDQYTYPTNDQYAYPTNEGYTGEQYAESSSSSSAAASTGGRGPNMIELDDVGLQKLGMRKARDAPITVIDVHARDQMGQAQQVRQAMSASSHSQSKPVDLASIEHLKPSAGQKRKHNIMSLAYQAKANQHQLSASWASGRQTKAETQAKYGF
ncbi:hypothetical protein BGX24_003132 [Mortierella sp. AD032]|nr:hypothetical protein BGX24_003132 [Mortierella sp. AD032]